MRLHPLLVLVLVLAGCPGEETPSPPPTSRPTPATVASEGSASGAGSLTVVVKDERGRPVDGAAVWIAGLKPRTPCPDVPVVLEQRDLEFRPPFLVARRGQRLEVRNSDGELHNVHSQDECCQWNVSVTSGKSDSRVLDVAGEATLLCNVHAHMHATLLVLDADFARTDAHGEARLEGVAAGARKVVVQALDRPRAQAEATVEDGKTVSVSLALAAVVLPVKIVPPEELPWPTLAARVREALEASALRAEQKDAVSAREQAELALGRWFSGSGLFVAIRDFDAESGIKEHRDRFERLKSGIGKAAALAEAAASAPDDERAAALEKLKAHVEKVATLTEEVARKLPPRPRSEKKP